MTRLRTVFFGTPEFAIPALTALRRETDVLAVITQPDRPKGRGRRLSPPPAAEAARVFDLPVLQPPRLRDAEVVASLRALAPDVHVTVAYGKIIPLEVLEIPPLGSVNLHPSLLPRYRGASPIATAILNGERETGVTVMYMSAELDAGDLILQRRIAIAPEDTTRTLEERLAQAGADVLLEALRLVAAGTAPRTPQDHGSATFTTKLEKEHGRIDWTAPAAQLVNLVRAMDPWPSAYTTHRGRLLKVWKAVAEDGSREADPGTVLEIRPGDGIVVATGQGALRLLEVQPEDKRRMSGDDYARGARLTPGARLAE
jgi:methionyl-tRNA formyltransferase